MESTNLVRGKGTHNGMEDSAVMEDYEILLAPVMGVHELLPHNTAMLQVSIDWRNGVRHILVPWGQWQVAASCTRGHARLRGQ